jgi:hypothetical protein
MKTKAQIEALIDELTREADIDPSKEDHHTIAIVTLHHVLDDIYKPQVLKEMAQEAQGVEKEALLWVLSDI